jgi:hypothetical protein
MLNYFLINNLTRNACKNVDSKEQDCCGIVVDPIKPSSSISCPLTFEMMQRSDAVI